VREIASGLFIFILLAGGSPHLLHWFMLAATGIPVGDALIVLRSNGPKVADGIHGATAVVMLAISAPPHRVTARHAASAGYCVH
jgi:hypothetical protein